MHHICQFSLCRLQVESRAIGQEVQVWFRVPTKKVSFSALSLVQLPLGVLLRVKLGATKRIKNFPLILLHICIILLQQGCYRVNYKAKYMVVTTLNYNLATTLLHPCNKVAISVWVV